MEQNQESGQLLPQKIILARTETSNEYYTDVVRPHFQCLFWIWTSICRRMFPAILCFPLSVSVWHWCTLKNSWRWTKDVGFWWIQLLCRHLYITVIPKTLQNCWIVLPYHLYNLYICISRIHSQSNYKLLLLLFWLHHVKASLTNCFMTFTVCKKTILHPKNWEVTTASPITAMHV